MKLSVLSHIYFSYELLLGRFGIHACNILLVEKISVFWVLKFILKSICFDWNYSSLKSSASFRLRRNKDTFQLWHMALETGYLFCRYYRHVISISFHDIDVLPSKEIVSL